MASKVQIIINAKDKAGPVLKNVAQGLAGIGKTAAKGAGLLAGATAGMGAAMTKLAADAAPLQQIQGAFEGIATSSGESAEAMLASLQASSAGMVSQRDLMMTYNKAAQLVGDQFANELPEAMSYLSKVAGATGEDMDYMLNSLVVGVGRLSPMILDNLGIQVALSEATDRAAQMFGVEAEELTKAQQQAGMMNVVMEKLAANTANMPEMAGSATAAFGQLNAQLANLKDQIGLALLPAITPLIENFRDLIYEYGPKVSEIFGQFATELAEVIPPAVLLVNDALTRMAQVLGITSEDVTGMDVILGALKGTLDAVVIGVQAFAVGMQLLATATEAVVNFIQQANEAFKQFNENVGQFTGAATLGTPEGGRTAIPGFGYAGGFQAGGVVPGPVGAPRLATVHGGEKIIPVGGNQTIQLVVDGQVLAEVIAPILGGRANQMRKLGGVAGL